MNDRDIDTLRVVLIVSTDPSDMFFARELLTSHNVVSILVEDMTPVRDESPIHRKFVRNLTRPLEFLRKIWEMSYGRLHARNAEYADPEYAADFDECGTGDFGEVPFKQLKYGDSPNSPENIEWVRSFRPDVLVTCGGSLLRQEILEVPEHGALNLHGGLSQYYRGIRTTDWAILNDEPEKIGATVHFISAGIDDGDIVWQGRPVISVGDHPNQLYGKIVRLGIEMMRQALNDLAVDNLKRARLESLGALYLKRAFTAATLRAVWQQYKRGRIDAYVREAESGGGRTEVGLVQDFNLRCDRATV